MTGNTKSLLKPIKHGTLSVLMVPNVIPLHKQTVTLKMSETLQVLPLTLSLKAWVMKLATTWMKPYSLQVMPFHKPILPTAPCRCWVQVPHKPEAPIGLGHNFLALLMMVNLVLNTTKEINTGVLLPMPKILL